MLTGCLLFVSDKMTPGHKTEKNMRIRDALIIGCCQCVATIPGLSRSGTTITAGIATGLDRGFAMRFSFLLSIPAVLGANVLSIVDAIREGFDASLLPIYLVGMPCGRNFRHRRHTADEAYLAQEHNSVSLHTTAGGRHNHAGSLARLWLLRKAG